MIKRCHLWAIVLGVLTIVPSVRCASVFQFEVLSASDDWIVIRENIPVSSEDTTACTYPGLDPSRYVGAAVHFFSLSAEAKRGRLVQLEKPASSMTLYAPARPSQGCTSASDAKRAWDKIAAHAKDLGIQMSATSPTPVVLGAAVAASACALAGNSPLDSPPCRRQFEKLLINQRPIRIAVSLVAIPEAPDEHLCQYVGYRFGVAMQVVGLDFGKMGSDVAPGGFATHYDCRTQQFDPLRLYRLDHFMVLVGGFSGTNIADRNEYPFIMVFPTRIGL